MEEMRAGKHDRLFILTEARIFSLLKLSSYFCLLQVCFFPLELNILSSKAKRVHFPTSP